MHLKSRVSQLVRWWRSISSPAPALYHINELHDGNDRSMSLPPADESLDRSKTESQRQDQDNLHSIVY